MLPLASKVQDWSLLVRHESSCTPPLNIVFQMHPIPNNGDGGRKRTRAPYVHTSLQHLTTPTLFHQTDDPNTAPSFAPPNSTTVNYYAEAHQEYAPLTGSYSRHPPLEMDPSHNSTYHHHHASALQSHRSAHPISSGEWPEAGSAPQPPYQMGSTDRRYGEDAVLWHSFLTESSVQPPSGSGGPSDTITSVVGEPIQCVLLQPVTKPPLTERVLDEDLSPHFMHPRMASQRAKGSLKEKDLLAELLLW